MGVLVSCDLPSDTEESPVSLEKSVQVIVQVNDPETGVTQSKAYFCTDHGDQVTNALEQMGFPPFE